MNKKKSIINSLGFRITFFISGILFVLSLFLILWIEQEQTKNIQKEEMAHAKIFVTTLAKTLQTLMLNGSGTLVRKWLENLHGTGGILDIAVLRRDKKEAFLDTDTIEAVNNYIKEPRFYREPLVRHNLREVSAKSFKKALLGKAAFELNSPDRITIFMPLKNDVLCRKCHGYDDGAIRGVFVLSLSTLAAQGRINAMRNKLWSTYFLVTIILGVILWTVLHFSVLRPISQLHYAIESISRGEQNILVPVNRRDELGKLAVAFNNMQKDLHTSETHIKTIMDNVIDGIFTIDYNGIIESFNPAAERLFGYSFTEIRGKSIKILLPESYKSVDDSDIVNYLCAGQERITGIERELAGIRKNGATFFMDVTISDMCLSDKHLLIGIVRDITRDITSRKAQTAALEYQSLHDSLTNLPNLSLFSDRLQQAIITAQRKIRYVAVLFMDINHFKEINDTLGHHVGDLLLKQVAQRLQKKLRGVDTVTRLGGDKFVMLLPGISGISDAGIMAERVLLCLNKPFTINDQKLDVSVIIGIAIYPEHGRDINSLLQRADVAMYSAKRLGWSFAFYDAAKDQHSIRRLTLMNDIRDAIENNNLFLYYQPKMNIKTNSIVGVEALVRWQHPKYGLIQPEEFISLVEQTGLIRSLTQWVLNIALHQSYITNQNYMEISMAVNLFPKNLQDQELVKTINILLDKWQVTSRSLTLEITESAIMSNPDRVMNTTKKLSRMGIKFSIDDFGTGYSSMSYLKELPVEEIKIDRSFVMGMTENSNDEVIVRSIIELGHNLGLQVIAEGVEDEGAWNLLEEFGCDIAQGHYISHPLPPDKLMDWLKGQQI